MVCQEGNHYLTMQFIDLFSEPLERSSLLEPHVEIRRVKTGFDDVTKITQKSIWG